MLSHTSKLIDSFSIKSNWKIHSENLKARYSDLTTEDIELSPNEEKFFKNENCKKDKKSQVEVLKLIESTEPRML
jgi:hypothetical protein